jgi:hypothetical protein
VPLIMAALMLGRNESFTAIPKKKRRAAESKEG